MVEDRIGGADGAGVAGPPGAAVGATVPVPVGRAWVEQADIPPAPAAAASTPNSRLRRRMAPIVRGVPERDLPVARGLNHIMASRD
ncbi:hypothetical protein KRMM14A1259_07180 [Krasilnikovia sp. MM14-A1259]